MRSEIRKIKDLFKNIKYTSSYPHHNIVIKLNNPIFVEKGAKFVWKTSSGSSTDYSKRNMFVGSLILDHGYIRLGNKHGKLIGPGFGADITACSTELLKQICELVDISSKSKC